MNDHAGDELPEIDIEAPSFKQDPLPVLRAVRREHWIARSARGFEVVSYDGCTRLYQHTGFRHGAGQLALRNGLASPRTLPMLEQSVMLLAEGERHSQLRRAISPWFTPRQVARLHDATVELVRAAAADAAADGGCDVVPAIATAVPARMLCRMIGAPDRDGSFLARASAANARVFLSDPGDVAEILSAYADLAEYVGQLIAAKRSDPGDDLTTFLLADGAGDREVANLVVQVLAAGVDNTANSIALALWTLATVPDAWERIARDPSLAPAAVEECARFNPRVRSDPVFSPDEEQVLGQTIPAGSFVTLHSLIGNRDAAVFEDPDSFKLDRASPRPHLNFGAGRHFCLGAALARSQIEAVIATVTSMWRTPRVSGEVEATFDEIATVSSLPLAFDPRPPP